MRTGHIHVYLDIRGALTWPRKRLLGLFISADGRKSTADQTRAFLMNELAKGHRYLPIGDCDGFSYETGCPGHDDKEVPR